MKLIKIYQVGSCDELYVSKLRGILRDLELELGDSPILFEMNLEKVESEDSVYKNLNVPKFIIEYIQFISIASKNSHEDLIYGIRFSKDIPLKGANWDKTLLMIDSLYIDHIYFMSDEEFVLYKLGGMNVIRENS